MNEKCHGTPGGKYVVVLYILLISGYILLNLLYAWSYKWPNLVLTEFGYTETLEIIICYQSGIKNEFLSSSFISLF